MLKTITAQIFVLAATAITLVNSGAAQTVTPISPTATNHVTLAGVRYRGMAPAVNGQEIFLGVEPLGNGAPYRVETGTAWGTTNAFSVAYDATLDRLVATANSSTLVYPSFSTQLATLQPGYGVGVLNALRITLTLRELGPTMALSNVQIDGNPLGSFTAIYNDTQAWLVTGYDFTQSFTLTGSIDLTGTYTNNQELSKIEIALTRLAICADGIIELDEDCEDGNAVSGDCCSAGCQFETTGDPCSDGDACTTGDACDGTGTCEPGTTPLDCDDQSPCTADSCVPASGCVNTATPQTGCRTAERSFLLINNRTPDDRDRLSWTWIKGAATTYGEFSDPINSTDYWLCLYENGAGAVSPQIQVPASPRWKSIRGNKGYRYRELTGSESGVQALVMRAGIDGRSRIRVRARGPALPDPVLPLALPVRAQLVNATTGLCWEGTFDDRVQRNSDRAFRAVDK